MAYKAMLIAYSIKLFMVIVLYIHVWMYNKKRDREHAAAPISEKEVIEMGMHDATEFDNKGFRYTL
jgi:heme/copper-type cytochrome/quinol oxidase subunit 2